MKRKKILESLKQARQAVEQANQALINAMQELNDNELDMVSGAGNPFADSSRVPTHSIDSDLRNNG